MKFNNHHNLDGQHAFMGASKYHWINYDDDKLTETYKNLMAIQRGTELHDFAKKCIELKQKLPSRKKTLNMFVNDAIGFNMTPEQPLYYSENCFGTADAICFRDGILRIHDLKTGETKAHMEQLLVYAALFCLEYRTEPEKMQTELRIYQSNEIYVCNPEPIDIRKITEKIIRFNKLIERLKNQED